MTRVLMQPVNRVIILVGKLARQLELVVCSRAFECTSRIIGSNLYKTHQHAPIDEPFAPRVPILWGWVLEDRVHRPYPFCLHLKMSLVPVVQPHTVSS